MQLSTWVLPKLARSSLCLAAPLETAYNENTQKNYSLSSIIVLNSGSLRE